MPRAGESTDEWENLQASRGEEQVQNHTDSQRPLIHMTHFLDDDMLNCDSQKQETIGVGDKATQKYTKYKYQLEKTKQAVQKLKDAKVALIKSKKTWKHILKEFLPKGRKITIVEEGMNGESEGYYFTASNVYETCEELLRNIYPNNKTIRSSIKSNLQLLRDDGVIEFVNNKGLYKWK